MAAYAAPRCRADSVVGTDRCGRSGGSGMAEAGGLRWRQTMPRDHRCRSGVTPMRRSPVAGDEAPHLGRKCCYGQDHHGAQDIHASSRGQWALTARPLATACRTAGPLPAPERTALSEHRHRDPQIPDARGEAVFIVVLVAEHEVRPAKPSDAAGQHERDRPQSVPGASRLPWAASGFWPTVRKAKPKTERPSSTAITPSSPSPRSSAVFTAEPCSIGRSRDSRDSRAAATTGAVCTDSLTNKLRPRADQDGADDEV